MQLHFTNATEMESNCDKIVQWEGKRLTEWSEQLTVCVYG